MSPIAHGKPPSRSTKSETPTTTATTTTLAMTATSPEAVWRKYPSARARPCLGSVAPGVRPCPPLLDVIAFTILSGTLVGHLWLKIWMAIFHRFRAPQRFGNALTPATGRTAAATPTKKINWGVELGEACAYRMLVMQQFRSPRRSTDMQAVKSPRAWVVATAGVES